jgi:CRP/FNR family cyclic AMP-dependent transcriptional regulator
MSEQFLVPSRFEESGVSHARHFRAVTQVTGTNKCAGYKSSRTVAKKHSSRSGAASVREKSDRQLSGAEERDPISFPNGMSAYPVLSDLCIERLLGIQAISGHIARSAGSVLFAEGQKVLGVYVLWNGRVKLSIGSNNGKSLILAFVGRGTVLGLPAAILGLPHGATAEVVKPAKVSFLSREDLLRHLHAAEAAAYAAAEMVSAICYSVLAEIKTIHLSQSADQKMARFLLGLRPMLESSNGQTQVTLEQSQEEIGQMIGLSRETVARVISRFKKRRILELRTPTLVIHDKTALEKLAEFPDGRGDHRADV